jgi:hypothetical protein
MTKTFLIRGQRFIHISFLMNIIHRTETNLRGLLVEYSSTCTTHDFRILASLHRLITPVERGEPVLDVQLDNGVLFHDPQC